MKGPFFLCNSDPHHLVTSFIGAPENLDIRSEAIMKTLFIDIKTKKKIKPGSIFEKLAHCQNRREQASLDDCENDTCISTQLLQINMNWFVDLWEHLERFCNVLPVFGSNSAKYDLSLTKSFLLPILVNDRDNESTVIRRTNQFIAFKFCDIQLLNIGNFLSGATSFGSFVKAYKTSET